MIETPPMKVLRSGTIRRIARRDLKASWQKAAYIVAAIAVSAGIVSGVRGAETAVRRGLENSSREWLAADVSIHTKDAMTQAQSQALDRLRARAVEWTVAISTVSMASSDNAPDPGFVTVKAVDPRHYPFYGAIRLDPARSLASALDADTVAVSPDVLSRLQVRTGDAIRIAGRPFRIAAVIEQEPDRFAGTVEAGMRAIVTEDGYERSGLARGGGTQLYRILLRVPDAAAMDGIERELEAAFPDATVIDSRGGDRQVVSTAETAIASLGFSAVKVLVLGVFGIVLAIRHFLEQRMPTIAVMKFCGARNRQIGAVFLVELGAMTAAAFLLSIPLGYAARATILAQAAKFVPLSEATRWSWDSVAASAFATLFAAAPALIDAALIVRRVRPAAILRKDSGERLAGRRWGALEIALAGLALAGIAAVSARLAGSWKDGALMLAATLANLAAVATVTMAVLFLLGLAKFRSSIFYLGLANLRRRANHAVILVATLATVATTALAGFDINQAIALSVASPAPFDGGNLFVAGFDDSYRSKVLNALSVQPGVQGTVQLLALANLRLTRIDGAPLDLASPDIPRHWVVACAAGASAAISDDTARLLGVRAGSTIEMRGRGRPIPIRIRSIRAFSPVEKIWSSMILDCNALPGQNLYDYAAARVAPDRLNSAAQAMHAAFPAIAVIRSADLAAAAFAVADGASSMLRALAWYTVCAGLAVLIAAIAGSRSGRRREIGTMLALGARRRVLAAIYLAEFAAIGVLAGVIGSAFSSGLVSITLFAILRRWAFSAGWRGVAVTILVSAAVTPAVAWVQNSRLFRMMPMDVLRRE